MTGLTLRMTISLIGAQQFAVESSQLANCEASRYRVQQPVLPSISARLALLRSIQSLAVNESVPARAIAVDREALPQSAPALSAAQACAPLTAQPQLQVPDGHPA